MKKQKVAIIGAGICGLYLAWKLSEKGHKVTVFEKKGEIGKEVCSGLFSERILKFVPQSKKLVQNQISSTLIHFPKKTLKIKFSKKFLVMSHFKLDRLTANLAEKSGAKIILNNPVTNFPAGYDRIIGCDGAISFVRKKLEMPDPVFRLAIQGFISKRDNSDFAETWPYTPHLFGPEGQKGGGYIWKIPRGEKTEYGIVANPQEAKRLFKEFLKESRILLKEVKKCLIPQGFLIPCHSKITLCGDAAGLTKPWSGGGVIWGLTGADILLKNFPDFLTYRKKMKTFFGPKIIFSKLTTKTAYFLGFKIPWLLPQNIKIESDFLI